MSNEQIRTLDANEIDKVVGAAVIVNGDPLFPLFTGSLGKTDFAIGFSGGGVLFVLELGEGDLILNF